MVVVATPYCSSPGRETGRRRCRSRTGPTPATLKIDQNLNLNLSLGATGILGTTAQQHFGTTSYNGTLTFG